MTDLTNRRTFLFLLIGGISVAFVAMLRPFLLTILLSAIFTGVSYPLYKELLFRLRGRKALAAISTLVLLLALVLAPLFMILGAAANQALQISQTVRPRLEQLIDEPGEFESRLRSLPGYTWVEPYREELLTRTGELIGGAGKTLFDALSATTRATVLFTFHFFVLLYTVFFFLTSGPRMLDAALSYMPLTEFEKDRMLGKFVSVTRATLKGTLLIGATQGTLGGLAMWAVGIDGAVFWGAVMTVLSIVPGVGAAFVLVPAGVVLIVGGEVWRGVGLVVFSIVVVSTVDNLLRPLLVGRDTQMHELLIFFSTLGGLLLFGPSGFIIGPILAALFVTVWEMFGTPDTLVPPGAPDSAANP